MKAVFFSFLLVAGLPVDMLGQDRIEWSATRLTVNDFKGKPPEPGSKQSLIARSGVESSLNGPEVKNLKTFNNQITNFFYPNDSWILWTDKSRLRYFQTLFDMDEWMARELRNRYAENRQIVLAGNFFKIDDEVRQEFSQIREQYNGESDFGTNPLGQMNWETKISERLISLSAYCKRC